MAALYFKEILQMNWDAVGATAETIAAIGVFFSVIYLGLQIRQNTKWLRQQAFQLSTNEIRRHTGRFADSKEITELWLKGVTEHENLDRTELVRFSMIVFEHLSIYATYLLHDEEGMMGLRESAYVNVNVWIRRGWFLQWWETWQVQFPPEFRVFMKQLIEENA
jgi:hypothetical protein